MVIHRQHARALSALVLALLASGLFSGSGAGAVPRAAARHWRIVTELGSRTLTCVAAPTERF